MEFPMVYNKNLYPLHIKSLTSALNRVERYMAAGLMEDARSELDYASGLGIEYLEAYGSTAELKAAQERANNLWVTANPVNLWA